MKPLLAATLEDPTKLPWHNHILVSPKYDGIRALKYQGAMVSRNLKPIRNAYVQECLKNIPEGLDGELVVGPPNEGLVFNRTTSGIMSAGGKPEFKYYVFDMWNSAQSYLHRFDMLAEFIAPYRHMELVTQYHVRGPKEFMDLEEAILKDGYEGVMVRGGTTRYKFGRSTNNEGIIWKFKRFSDGEAFVVGVVQGVKNLNEVKTDLLGYKERSTHQENMAPSGMIGAIIGRDLKTGEIMDISPGKMAHNARIDLYKNQDQILGKIIRFKTFNYGRVNAPRFATFQGFRHEDDL